jgi:hypothetical protein
LAAVHAGLGRLARGVGLSDQQFVYSLEAGAKALQQVARAAVGVRLEKAYQPPAGEALASGGQRGPHLRRVVRVVVHDGDAGGFTHQLEAPADAPEGGHSLLDRPQRHLQRVAGGDGGQSVGHVVPPRDAGPERAVDPRLSKRSEGVGAVRLGLQGLDRPVGAPVQRI